MKCLTQISRVMVLANLVLLAVVPAFAQASGEFLIEGETFSEAEISKKTFLGTANSVEFLTESGIKIFCEGGEVSGSLIKGGKVYMHTLYDGCAVLESKTCIVYEKLDEFGEPADEERILSSGTGTLLLHEGEHYLLLEGLGGSKQLALFDIYGKFCPLNEGADPWHVELHGSTVLLLPDILKNQLLHTFETLEPSTLQTLFSEDGLFLSSEKAHLGGSTGSVHLFEEEGAMPKWSGQ